jgi:hypothetical protein
MKTTIYLSTDRGLTVIVGGDGNWRGKVCLEDKQVQCVVADSNKRSFIYCGTFGDGLFTSERGGATWEKSASFQEGAPGLRGRFAAAHHVLADAGFADVDPKFEQLPVDAGCTPTRILPAHPAD